MDNLSKCSENSAGGFLDITKNSSVINKEYSAVSDPVEEANLLRKPHHIV